MMAGHHRVVMRSMFIAAPLHLTLLVVLIALFGPVGAALSNVVSALVVGSFFLLLTYKLTGHRTTVLPVFSLFGMQTSKAINDK